MIDEPLPDGIEEGATAYVVVSNHITGMGSYPTAHRVTVSRVTATLVRALNPDNRVTINFRRPALRAPGTGRGYGTDRLAPLNDPEVRRAHLIARVVAALPGLDIDSHVRAIHRVSLPDLASNPQEEIERLLTAVAALRDAATQAHTRLLREQESAV